MFIKNLQLKNYGAIKEGELEFQKGFNILSGANGMGKSHIIRALSYLILNHNEGKIEDDCNWNSDEFIISTELEHEDKTFKIQNGYDRKGGASKQLLINNNKFDTNKDVTDELTKYFDPSYCKPALVAFQGEMDVVSSTPSSRRENLKKIYDLSFIKELETLNNELDSINNEIKEIDKQISILKSKEYKLYEKERPSLTKEELEEKQNKLKEKQDKFLQIEIQIESYELKVQKTQDLKKQITEKEKLIKKLQGDIKTLESKINECKNNIDNPDYNKSEKLKEQINSIKLERLKDFNVEEFEQLKEKLYEEKNNLYNVKKEYELAQQGKCPTCGRDFHSDDQKKYEEVYIDKKDQVDELKEKYKQLEKEYKQWQVEKEENEKKKQKKNELSQQLKFELEKADDIINNNKKALQEYEDTLNNSITYIKTQEESKKQLEENYEQALKEQPEEPEQLYKNKTIIKDTIKNFQKEIEQYNKIVDKNEWVGKENGKILKQKKEDEKEKEELDKEYNKLNKELKEYESAINILKKDFPNYIINTLKQEIENGMNDILDEAYNRRYHVQIKEKRNGLTITYGEDKEIKLASGAEKNLFTIGFKNAFTKIAGLKVLLLDEVDNFMDEDIAKQTFTVINSLIEQEELNQVILISHKALVKEMLEADYGAKVFEVNNGRIIEGE